MRRYLWDGESIPRERAAEAVAAGIESFESRGFGFWTVSRREEPELVGFCGLRPIGESADVEVLYGIAPRLWGRGLATEAARAVLDFGFRRAALPRIYAGADPPNRASFRVIEKLGMRFADMRVTAAGETPHWVIEQEEFFAANPARDNPE